MARLPAGVRRTRNVAGWCSPSVASSLRVAATRSTAVPDKAHSCSGQGVQRGHSGSAGGPMCPQPRGQSLLASARSANVSSTSSGWMWANPNERIPGVSITKPVTPSGRIKGRATDCVEVCDKYNLPYTTGSFLVQYGKTWRSWRSCRCRISICATTPTTRRRPAVSGCSLSWSRVSRALIRRWDVGAGSRTRSPPCGVGYATSAALLERAWSSRPKLRRYG